MNSAPRDAAPISLLSRLLFQGPGADPPSPGADQVELSRYPDCDPLSEQEFNQLVRVADKHHVTVRALEILRRIAVEGKKKRLEEWCEQALSAETGRARLAIESLNVVVNTLENSGCAVTVIKSLDHWPDVGSDLDLFTSATREDVTGVMRERLGAREKPRSWGDRLASKWNFALPGLPELVEIHVRYLGQTGEQKAMAERVLARRGRVEIQGHGFPVPAPEERILISTLQRMYRHFYFRLCDILDTAALLARQAVDFRELERGAELGGIWPGVRSFLEIVENYAKSFGAPIGLPAGISTANNDRVRLELRGDFLRVPIWSAAGLYGSQLVAAGRHGDLRAVSRLGLFPPLAVSALIAYRLTGSDKGVW